MKILKRLLLVLVVVLAVAVVSLLFWSGHVIKHSVNLMGDKVLGVPVTLEHARLHPLKGYVSLVGLVVGNPEGFNTKSLFDMKHLEVDMDMRSLFSDPIVIERILVDSPQITYEVGLRRTNLGALLANVQTREQKETAQEIPARDKKPGKTIVIKELKIVDARAQVSATALGGRVVPVQLATITLNDLGGPDQSLSQITAEVLQAVLGAVGNAVAGSGDLVGDGLKSALDGVGALGDTATDGAKALVGTAGDGTRAVTDTISSGFGRLRKLAVGDDAADNQED